MGLQIWSNLKIKQVIFHMAVIAIYSFRSNLEYTISSLVYHSLQLEKIINFHSATQIQRNLRGPPVGNAAIGANRFIQLVEIFPSSLAGMVSINPSVLALNNTVVCDHAYRLTSTIQALDQLASPKGLNQVRPANMHRATEFFQSRLSHARIPPLHLGGRRPTF